MTAYDMPELLWRDLDVLPPGDLPDRQARVEADEPGAPGATRTAGARPCEGLVVAMRGVRFAGGSHGNESVLDLDVNPGEFVAVIGDGHPADEAIGRLLCGLEPVLAGGLTIAGRPPHPARMEVRSVSADPCLLPWKRVYQNVELGMDCADAPSRARAALLQVGLHDLAHAWPEALDAATRYRVALARAIVREPCLLVAECPRALLPVPRQSIQHLLESLWQERGFTAILTGCDVPAAVALASRAIVMRDGRIVADLPVDLPRPRLRLQDSAARFGADRITARLQALVAQPGEHGPRNPPELPRARHGPFRPAV